MAIKFVDSTASGANNGTSWANAYTSLNTAISAANHAPGDQYLVSGTFNETVAIAEVAAVTTPTRIQGDDKSGGAGVGQPATFTIDGQSTRANGYSNALGNVSLHYVIKDCRVTGCTGVGFAIGTASDFIVLKNCKADANGSWGFQCDNWARFENCTALNNTANGGFDADDNCLFIGCLSQGNTGAGFSGGASLGTIVAFGCVASSNSGDGFLTPQDGGWVCINCTTDGDGKDTDTGFNSSNAALLANALLNCIAYDCTTGISNGQNIGELAIGRNNLVNGNATAYSNAATHMGEVTAAPDFVNEATGDYRLNSTSPAKATGYDGGLLGTGAASKMDIGAIQREEPAGAAGGVIGGPNMRGGMMG